MASIGVINNIPSTGLTVVGSILISCVNGATRCTDNFFCELGANIDTSSNPFTLVGS